MRCLVGVNFNTSCKVYHYYYDLCAEVEKGDELQVDSPYSGITSVRVVEVMYKNDNELDYASSRLKHIMKNLSRGEEFETNKFTFKIKRASQQNKEREVKMRDLSTFNTGADLQKAIQDDQKESVKQTVYKFLLKLDSNIKAVSKTVAGYQKVLSDLQEVQIDLVKDFDAGNLDQDALNNYTKRIDTILD